MTISRSVFLVVVVLVVSAPSVRANGITDPALQISDPACTIECPSPVGTVFGFTASANGGGILSFTSTLAISTLDIETPAVYSTTPPSFGVNCTAPEVFFSCSVQILAGAVTDMFFSPGEGAPGIPANFTFFINLNNGNSPTGDVGGWGSFQPFLATANLPSAPTTPLITVPEPGTLLLVGTGIAASFAARRRARNKS